MTVRDCFSAFSRYLSPVDGNEMGKVLKQSLTPGLIWFDNKMKEGV